MNTPRYTNLKFPQCDRKGRVAIERTLNDKLGTTAWRHDENGTVECILVLLDGVKTFVTLDQYCNMGASKSINGKPVAISKSPLRTRRKYRYSRLLRYSEGCYAW